MVDYRQTIPDYPVGAPKEEQIEFLESRHGDIEDAKLILLFAADEEGFDVEPEDIEAVTDEPPLATFR